MADPREEQAGMDIIKDNFGLTDEELSQEGDLDWGDDEGDTGEQHETEPPSDPNSFDSHEQPDNRQRSQDDGQREQRQQPADPLKQNTLRFDPRTTFRQDKKGNLVDTKTGEIIARAGSEARIYQRVHKEASDYIRAASSNVQNQIAAERGKVQKAVDIGLSLHKELDELKGTMKQINAFDLPKEGLIEAAQYYKQAQTDPVGVLKNLLTRAALSGIDITQLGMDGNSFDAKTLVEMVRREVAQGIEPIKQYTTQRQQERDSQQTESQYLQQAERQVNEFFGNNREAIPYTHIFHSVLSQPQFQRMSLGEIWDKIQLHLMRNGVDPRQAPSRSQRQRLNGTQEAARSAPSRSLPSGQGMAPQGSDRGRGADAGPAHPGMSYDAIIREILASAK